MDSSGSSAAWGEMLVDTVLARMTKDFDGPYSEMGPSIAPERVPRVGESTILFKGSHTSEFQFHLHCDHAWTAIATQTHAEQACGRRC